MKYLEFFTNKDKKMTITINEELLEKLKKELKKDKETKTISDFLTKQAIIYLQEKGKL